MPVPPSLLDHFKITIPHLLTLDEKALSQLNDEHYLALKKAGAIALGYAISFSLNQLHLLGRLTRLHGGAHLEEVDLDKFFGDDDDSVKF